MEFYEKALYDSLKVHLKKVEEWLGILKKNLHKGRLDRFKKNSSHEHPQQPSVPTTGSSCKQIGSEIENEQQDTSVYLKDIKTRIHTFETEMDTAIKSLHETQKKQSREGKQKSTTTIQVYDRDDSDYLEHFMTAKKFIRHPFKVINVKTVSDIDKDKPLIILCLGSSRLQSDADYASQLITSLGDFHAAFVVIHKKKENDLPKVSSESVLCTTEKYKNMPIIDAAFIPEHTFYDSKMNADAARKLMDFLNTFCPAYSNSACVIL